MHRYKFMMYILLKFILYVQKIIVLPIFINFYPK